MSKRRQERVSVEIKRAVSEIIRKEIKDPRIDFSTVSITRVEVASDLSHAKINVSILGDSIKQKETIKVLEKAKGYIRTQLSKEIQLRHAPEIEFRLDKSIEHGIRIATLLEEIKAEEIKKE
ncbi:MAG: 30S ribosome-binding factor RbfA [Syntrophomonadaceae bacterium]|jgi:ribosome-binding factor A